MTDETVQLMFDAPANEAEYMLLSVDDKTFTPNKKMAPGEFSSADFADIQMRGAIVPIIAVPAEEGAGYAFEVKDGRRRLRAYRRLFAAGMKSFGQIPALVYTTYSEEDAATWASNINSRRSPNALSDLESINAVMDRYEVNTSTKDGLRFLSSKTGIPVSTLKNRIKLLDMPQAFVTAAGENVPGTKNKKCIPMGALEVIASLNDFARQGLLQKLKDSGSLDWEDVQEAKSNQTASKVAAMQALPGFEDLAGISTEDLFVSPPAVEITSETISIGDVSGMIVRWCVEDWAKDPSIVFTIVDFLKIAFENGSLALREALNGDDAVRLAGKLGDR